VSSLSPRKSKQYMHLAEEGAKVFSTCGKRQYMAILLDDRHRVVGTGYNGGPSGRPHCIDGACPRWQEGSAPGSNYDNCISVHAEQNALIRATAEPSILIVNGPPCFTCAKLTVNSFVKHLYYKPDRDYKNWPIVREFLFDNGMILYEMNEQVMNNASR